MFRNEKNLTSQESSLAESIVAHS